MMEKKKTISLVSSSPVQAPLQCTRRLYFDGPGSFWRNTDFESDSPGISTKLQGLPSKNSTFWQLVKVTWRGTWMNYQQNNKERISRNEKSLPDAFQKKMVRPSNREDFAFILEIVEERHISNFLSKSFFLVNGITWRCWEQPWDELVHLNEFIATLVDFPDQPPGVFELPDANSTQYPKIPRSPPWRSAKITCKTRHLLPFPSSSFTTMPFVAPTQSSSTEKKTKDQGRKDFCHLIKLQCAISRSVEFFEEFLDVLLGLCRRHGEFWCHGVQQKQDFLKGIEVVSPKETSAIVLIVLIKLQVSKYQYPCVKPPDSSLFFENFKKNSLAFTSQWDRLFCATNLTKCQPFSFGSKKQTCQSKPLALFCRLMCHLARADDDNLACGTYMPSTPFSKLGPGQSPRGSGLSIQPQRNDGTVWKKPTMIFKKSTQKNCVHHSWLKDNSMSLCCRIRDWQVFNCSSMNAGRTEVSDLANTATQNWWFRGTLQVRFSKEKRFTKIWALESPLISGSMPSPHGWDSREQKKLTGLWMWNSRNYRFLWQ